MANFENLPSTNTPLNATNLNKLLSYKGILANNTDLNNVVETGIYYTADRTLSNAGSNYNWCYLIVVGYEAAKQQYLIKPVTPLIIMREYSGSPGKWCDWKNIAGEPTSTWTFVSSNINKEYFNGGNIKYKRMGNMIFVNLYGLTLKKNITNDNDNYATIVSGLPKSANEEIATLARYSDNRIMRVSLTTQGILRFHWTGSVSASDQSFEGNFFYITNS